MKDLGAAKNCLGIRITRKSGSVELDQEAYVKAMLTKFNMVNCKPAKIPMTERLSKDMSPKTEQEAARMMQIPYQEAVGSLMYLAQCTRPDILYAVNQLSRYNSNPGMQHWIAVKTLFRYLRGTSSFKLVYRNDGGNDINGYSDADWAADVDDRKSTSGYIFTLQGAAISWCCKRQPTIALSTCEAEYMALSAAVQEASWWQGLTAQFAPSCAITIHCDNQSAIAIAKNGGYNPRTKHIDIRHH
ncbi:uncharacterized protein LOC134207025 [Armigeres subalbatus]|uniref:uncharacterized protein LOC134207025 n=1 Tax=Armigeres subalbatus TaxID=124917 RepID=UPI002ED61A2F